MAVFPEVLMRQFVRVYCLVVFCSLTPAAQQSATPEPEPKPRFSRSEVMIQMQDGTHLQTAIFRPLQQHEPLPILLQRTPYGVPPDEKILARPSWKELLEDGYIVVFQNIRGRFKSEGTFQMANPSESDNAANLIEASDAYDTVDWLVKNVPSNNGRVGIFGVSYDGLTAALSLLKPHPALKAVSEQASPADIWMNDDSFRYGAFRLSYSFEYAVYEEADKYANTHFKFDTYDTYEWYLKLGPLSNVNKKYLHGKIKSWNDYVAHPNYDSHWQKVNFLPLLEKNTSVPNLNVAGFWDQEDPWGPWHIYKASETHDSKHLNFMVAGPWIHGSWHAKTGSPLGPLTFGDHAPALEFRQNIEAPWFRYWLHGKGEPFKWDAQTFQTGSNTWHTYDAWPPRESKPTNLYFHEDGTLSFDPVKGKGGFREYVSDPANPVPYRQRPISPTYPGGDWPLWEIQDQRFVDHRPDVLTFTSEPLEHDLVVTGELKADLFASTSGTDSDWVVKLIDVFPENYEVKDLEKDPPKSGDYAKSLNGYELMIAAEAFRGRFHKSFEHPQALVPGRATEFVIPLRSHDHVFQKGHRLMVQVQSTWFPVIDRNTQKFVPSIFEAKESDYIKTTQRIYSTRTAPSHITLPVMAVR
jgi:putative CocE/NonD family hydrolase